MSKDEERETIDQRLSSLRSENPAMVNAVEGKTIGHSQVDVETARAVLGLIEVVSNLAHKIEALRAEMERQTEGQG